MKPSADPYPATERIIVITEWARNDILELKRLGFDRDDWLTVRGYLERIARTRNVTDLNSVVELRMCAGMHRWKACNLRVVFEVDEDELVVWALLLRDAGTYQRVAIRLKQIAA